MNERLIRNCLLAVLVLFAANVYAIGCKSDSIKCEQKRIEKEFKERTGFQGDFRFQYNATKIDFLNGTFTSIKHIGNRDTTNALRASEQILSVLLEYLGIPRNQLVLTMNNGELVRYRQVINNIKFDGSQGQISFHFIPGYNPTVSIPIDLWAIPDLSQKMTVTEEQAVEKAQLYQKKQISEKNLPYEIHPSHKPVVKLVYRNVGADDNNPVIKLCWVVGVQYYAVFIDAVTGEEVRHIYEGSYLQSFKVSGPTYSTTGTPLNTIEKNIPHVYVHNQTSGYTNTNGYLTLNDSAFSDSLSLFSELKSDEIPRLTYTEILTNTSNEVYKTHSSHIEDNNSMHIVYDNGGYHAVNTFYQQAKYLSHIDSLLTSYGLDDWIDQYNIHTDHTLASNIHGISHHVTRYIELNSITNASLYSDVINHEITHMYVFQKISRFDEHDTLSSFDYDANDETYANYFPCNYTKTGIFTNPSQSLDLMGNWFLSSDLNHDSIFNEIDYSHYDSSLFIASALWKLRTDVTADTLNKNLIDILTKIRKYQRIINGTPKNHARFLFNCLMRMFSTDTSFLTTNTKQSKVIEKFNNVKLYFNPTIKTCDKNGNRQESFTYKSVSDHYSRDKLFLKIENCPPNTPIRIYILRRPFNLDGIQTPITYTDSMNISGLMDNIVLELEKTTDRNGVWTNCRGSINPGDNGNGITLDNVPLGIVKYDILVDVNYNSGNTLNDGKLRYKYTGTQDAIKGMDPFLPGFMINSENIKFLVFDIDHSGSMLMKLPFYNGFYPEKFYFAQRAAVTCLNSLTRGSKTGLVFFNENAYPVELRSNYHIQLNVWPDYELVKEAIEHQGSIGGQDTNIPNAIETAYRDVILNYANIDSVLTLLIVDGEHDITEQELVGYGFPMYPNNAKLYILTIGEPGFSYYNGLSRLAERWRGKVYTTNDEKTFIKSVLNFLIDINDINNIRYEQGVISPQDFEKRSYEFYVDSTIHGASIKLLFNNTDFNINALPIELIDPNGFHYTNEHTYEDVFFTNDGYGSCIDVVSPITGCWTVSFGRDAQIQDSIFYCLNISADKEFKYSVNTSPSMPTIYSGINFQVHITSPCYDVTGSNVLVDITDPDGITVTKTLFDDGTHNDGIPNDGIFGLTYLKNDKVGKYECAIRVTYPGDSYSCSRFYSFHNLADSLTSRNFHTEWNWVGFPKIPGDSLALVNAQDYFYSSLPNINQVLSQNGEIEFDGFDCNFDTIGMINGIEGYKLNISNEFDFVEYGSQVDTTQAINIFNDNWYWLSYPKKTRLEPEEIFADALQCFDYIMAEDWSMKKENGVWIEGENSSKPMLEYGDAFEAHAMQDAVLYWSPLSVSKPEVLRMDTQYYTYDMKPEYETVMIDSIYGSPEFAEIGVFYDNECIGAQVFEGYPIQILVYTPDLQKNDAPYEFRLFDGNKSNMTFTNVSDLSENQGSSHYLYPSPHNFRIVHLLKSDNVPPVVTMSQNYPNPFNPSTTIRFSLPATKQVKLRIYNIKGQLVKELLNESLERGFHTTNWNGKDQQGRNAASGLYFYRLDTEDKVIVKKAMMLK